MRENNITIVQHLRDAEAVTAEALVRTASGAAPAAVTVHDDSRPHHHVLITEEAPR